MPGSGETTLAILYVKGVPIECLSIEQTDNSETHEHRSTASHNVIAHSKGKAEWSVDLEKEVLPDEAPFDPEIFDASNPVDVVVVSANKRTRFVQGVTAAGSKRSNKENGKETVNWTMTMFKDKRSE